MATQTPSQRIPTRERRPSTGAPIVDIQGGVGPAGVTRPKHKRTFTGFGAGDIKSVEGKSILAVVTCGERAAYILKSQEPDVRWQDCALQFHAILVIGPSKISPRDYRDILLIDIHV